VSCGREADNALPVSDTRISRRHFQVAWERDGYWLEDLQSSNGTYLNGQRTQRARLAGGDVIQAGGLSLEFQLAGQAAPATVLEPAATASDALAPPAAALIVREGAEPGRVLPLHGPLTCGREVGNDLVVEDGRVSRQHFRVRWANGSYRLEDLGSRNGTYLNGERAETAELKAGDMIQAGAVRLEFRLTSNPLTTEPPARGGVASNRGGER
jgi:pSer/pThr/pTyr-binding forkhead associated (FHA) protein